MWQIICPFFMQAYIFILVLYAVILHFIELNNEALIAIYFFLKLHFVEKISQENLSRIILVMTDNKGPKVPLFCRHE